MRKKLLWNIAAMSICFFVCGCLSLYYKGDDFRGLTFLFSGIGGLIASRLYHFVKSQKFDAELDKQPGGENRVNAL